MEETMPTPPKTRGIVFVLVLVVLVAIVAYALLQHGFLFQDKGSILLAEGFPAERLSLVSPSGSVKEISKNVPGVLEDYARRGDTEVAIVRTDEGAFEVYDISGGARALTGGGARKASLAVSPNGMWAAYAELTELDSSLEEKTSSWIIHILNVKSGEVTALTSGFAPQFFVRDGKEHLLYTSPEGLTIANPEEATTQTLPLSVSQNIHAPIVVSEAGAYVAVRDDAVRIYSVFELQSLSPIIINPLRSLPKEAEAVAFSGTTLLGIVYGKETRLVQYGIKDAEGDKELSKLREMKALYYLLP